MGLDDFVNDEEEKEIQDRAEELKQNSPPGDSDEWKDHEPGTPDWVGFIESKECKVTQNDVCGDNLLSETGDAIKVMITGVDSTAIVCSNPIDLQKFV